MAQKNTNSFNLGVFTGTGQKDAHEVLANLFCKHIRIDADQDKVMQVLEAGADFDPELYEHILSETGAEINHQRLEDRANYINATLTQENLEEIKAVTEKHANSGNLQLSTAHKKASLWVSKMAYSVEDYKDIMDVTERDLMDFKNYLIEHSTAFKEHIKGPRPGPKVEKALTSVEEEDVTSKSTEKRKENLKKRMVES